MKNDVKKQDTVYVTTRIDEKMRRRLAEKILDHARGEERKALADLEHALGDEVYEDIYSREERRAMGRLPAGFLEETSSLKVKVGGQVHQVNFSILRRVALKHEGWEGAKSYPVSHPLAVRVCEVSQAKERAGQKYAAEYAKVMGVLRSCRTVRQLTSLWPEAAKFLDVANDAKKPVTDLAPLVRDLSRDLGL